MSAYVHLATLNDQFRARAGWVDQEALRSTGQEADEFVPRLLSKMWVAIRSYTDFALCDTEHNRGTVRVDGVTIRWEMKYLDPLTGGPSCDPFTAQRSIKVRMEFPAADTIGTRH